MNEDLKKWMNRKSMDRSKVCIRAFSNKKQPSGHPAAFQTGSVNETAATSVFVSEASRASVSRRLPHWQQSPLISGLMIVAGAVMVGLLMGWTVLTLLAPIPAG